MEAGAEIVLLDVVVHDAVATTQALTLDLVGLRELLTAVCLELLDVTVINLLWVILSRVRLHSSSIHIHCTGPHNIGRQVVRSYSI